MIYDAIVLGAGAAGLFCAARAGQRGRRVLVIERSEQPGKKILISGGGRCNFTNRAVSAANFLGANPHFAKSALARFGPGDFIQLVQKHGIAYHEKTLGQLFCDRSAQAILDLLLAECRDGNVELQYGAHLRGVTRDTHFRAETGAGVYEAAALVVATGGLSIPKLGATDFGYTLAKQFGLKIEPPYPALVPLTFDAADRERWIQLAGVSAEVVAAVERAKGARGSAPPAFREKLLFTHRGLSGPAVLQISSYWRPGQALIVDLMPESSFAESVERRRAAGDRVVVKTILAETLTRRLAERWMEVEGFTQPIPSLRKMDERLHAWRVTPAGTEGFEKAEVTGGGVSTADLDAKTMQARPVPGLFFIGEVVDVTGQLGGYNFQWAWSSAAAAAEAV